MEEPSVRVAPVDPMIRADAAAHPDGSEGPPVDPATATSLSVALPTQVAVPSSSDGPVQDGFYEGVVSRLLRMGASFFQVVRAARFLIGFYLLGFFYLQWAPTVPMPPAEWPFRVDLVGHVLLYFTLGVLLGGAMGTLPTAVRMRWVLGVGLVTGVLGEFVQGYVPGRTPDVADLAANWFGVMLAALVLSIWPRHPRQNDASSDAITEEDFAAPLIETREPPADEPPE